MEQTIDATAEDVEQEMSRELVPSEPPALAVTPHVKASELVERLGTIREAQELAMVESVDYGVIPGTNKPTLLKPGAEKLAVLFQLDVQLENERIWGPGEHLTVLSRATVYHAPTGTRLGFGEGTCSTKERKYAYRQQERTCPECGKAAIIKGKAEYGGGWVCFKKKDGCGAKYPDGAEAIEGQAVGQAENPDLPDLWNTVVKMAEKRARVDAVLAVTGASALFTQDVEDQGAPPSDPVEPPSAPAAQEPQREEMSPELYRAVVDAFQASTVHPDALNEWLDQQGIAEQDELHVRVSGLEPRTARRLKKWLDGQRAEATA